MRPHCGFAEHRGSVLALVALLVFAPLQAALAAGLQLARGNAAGTSWFLQTDSAAAATVPGTGDNPALSLSMNRSVAGHGLALSSYRRGPENAYQFRWGRDGREVSLLYGEGRTRVNLASPYAGVDPFLFHGGNHARFDFNGVTFGQRITDRSSLQATHVRVGARGLDDRTGWGLAWRHELGQVSWNRVHRASRYVGDAVSIGTRMGRHRTDLTWMKSATGVAYHGARYAFDQRSWRYSFSLEQSASPLFVEKNDLRFRFGVRYEFGRQRAAVLDPAVPDDDAGESESSPYGYLAGAGALAAIVALSSGSDSDGVSRVQAQHDAARAVLNRINPVSVKQNLEYGGYVYRNADGSYSSTRPVSGTPTSLTLPSPAEAAPAGAVTTASYHTHAAFDPRYDNENFSGQDLLTDIVFGIDGYLGTPAGRFKWHEVRANRVVTLGTIAN